MQQFRGRRRRFFRVHSRNRRFHALEFHIGRKVAARRLGRNDAAGWTRVARDTGAARAGT
jgi:hypothetical protein